MNLDLDTLRGLTGGRPGIHDVACPACGPERRAPANRTRRVMRVWLLETEFATYACARCSVSGYARDGSASPVDRAALAKVKAEMAQRERAAVQQRAAKATWLWRNGRSLRGTTAERYLRDVRGITGALPATLRSLPARDPYPPAVIGAYAIPTEPEPGVLQVDDRDVVGVQITRLQLDGTKATEAAKISIGRSLGTPIVLAPLNDGLGLAISEGAEDALSIAISTGCGAWAAGGASRLAALAETVPSYTDHVSILRDDDPAGRRGVGALAEGLRKRRIRCSVIDLGSKAAA